MAEDWIEDPLLNDLAALAREEETRERELFGERWDLLASGELGAEEGDRLAAEDGPEARQRYQAFRPLEPAFHDRVAARALTELGAAVAPRVPVSPPRPVRRDVVTGPPVRRGALGPIGWRGLAAAALLTGAVVLGPRLFAPPFPAYEVAVLPQGEASERSLDLLPRPETPALFHAGTAFEVAVRPLSPVENLHDTLEVRCLLQNGPEVRPWTSCAERAEVAPTLAVRVAGTVGTELSLEPGTWTLWIVLGRRGEITDLEQHPSLLTGEVVAKRGWIALRIPKPLRMEAGP